MPVIQSPIYQAFRPKTKQTSERKSRPVQRVIIPKGVVDPNQTTVIEIPQQYEKRSTVVAKQPVAYVDDTNSASSVVSDSAAEVYDSRYYEKKLPVEDNRTNHAIKHSFHQKKPAYEEVINKISNDTIVDSKSTPAFNYREHQGQVIDNNMAIDNEGVPRYKLNYTKGVEIPPQDLYYYEDVPVYTKNQDAENRYYSYGETSEYTNPKTYPYYQHVAKSTPRSLPNRARQYYGRYLQGNPYPQGYYKTPNHLPKNTRVGNTLEKVEAAEMVGLEKDLKKFQTARRRLMYDVSAMKMI